MTKSTVLPSLALEGHDGVVVSRATWMNRASLGPNVVIAPVVSGRTVWAAAERSNHLYVIEQPNYLGRFEHDVPQGVAAATFRRALGGRNAGRVTSIATPLQSEHVAAARNLSGRLSQIPGFKLPHGKAESPWLVACLPIDPEWAASQLGSAGFRSCVPISGEYPEFPGGLRIEVAWPLERNEHFARVIETAIRF